MDQGLLGPRLGPPGRGAPRGARENFREISGPGPGRRGAPRGPRFWAPRDPQNGAPKWAQNGPYIWNIRLEPPFRGAPPGGALCAPRGVPPGGQKSAHFFGYLITLPVGTVWATFSTPPFWDSLGQFGIMPIWTVFIACIECGLQIGLVLIASIDIASLNAYPCVACP